MELIKKRKILGVFSDGCLNFGYNNFFFPKNSQFFFYEKDFKNFYFYKKKIDQHLVVNKSEKAVYRKKFIDIKNK